jgi:peptidoglycan hydrolase CwlO-like protein
MGKTHKKDCEPHMGKPEAIAILARLAARRDLTAEEVTALEMGARRLLAKHCQRQRNWARRREQQAHDSKAAEPLSPEEELTTTVKRTSDEEQKIND